MWKWDESLCVPFYVDKLIAPVIEDKPLCIGVAEALWKVITSPSPANEFRLGCVELPKDVRSTFVQDVVFETREVSTRLLVPYCICQSNNLTQVFFHILKYVEESLETVDRAVVLFLPLLPNLECHLEYGV